MSRIFLLTILILVLTGLHGCSGRATFRPVEIKEHSRSLSRTDYASKYPPKPNDYPMYIISTEGPQLESEYYEIIGAIVYEKAMSTVLDWNEKRKIPEILKEKARQIGADIIVNAYSGFDVTIMEAAGYFAGCTVVRFKDPERAWSRIREIGVILK